MKLKSQFVINCQEIGYAIKTKRYKYKLTAQKQRTRILPNTRETGRTAIKSKLYIPMLLNFAEIMILNLPQII